MQQRFCDCGCAVWVRYLLPNMICRVIFSSERNHLDRLTKCPGCGKNLSIDELN